MVRELGKRRGLYALLACLLMVPAAMPAQANVASGVQKWRAGDWKGAVAEWTQPAARGDADALFNLGQAYRLGRGVEQNQSVAQDYYRRAAAKGHLAATANLGITLYQDGRKTEALQYLREAADKGDLRAGYVLGVATFTGDGAPRNPTLGYAYVLRARDGGLANADSQAARMATMLTSAERARAVAAAAGMDAGQPVPVALAGGTAPAPAATPAPARVAAPARNQPEAAPGTAQAATAEKPTQSQAEAGWRVQLGAYSSEQAARTAWVTLVSNVGDVLKGQTPVYSPNGHLVRLQVGPFPERATARDLCQELAASGRPCFVTKT